MPQVNLLSSLPKTKRDINARATEKTPAIIAKAKEYGKEYFDGDRKYGYGGYHYDGRWRSVARDIITFFHLGPGARILDVGCAKGFLVSDLRDLGMDAFGLDISEYAVCNCHEKVIGRIHRGNARHLPFPDSSFNLVLCINTIHNLPQARAIKALQEIQRVSGGQAFVQVDSYLNEGQKRLFEEWVLTAEFYGYPNDWKYVFEQAGYSGYYDWTIVE